MDKTIPPGRFPLCGSSVAVNYYPRADVNMGIQVLSVHSDLSTGREDDLPEFPAIEVGDSLEVHRWSELFRGL